MEVLLLQPATHAAAIVSLVLPLSLFLSCQPPALFLVYWLLYIVYVRLSACVPYLPASSTYVALEREESRQVTSNAVSGHKERSKKKALCGAGLKATHKHVGCQQPGGTAAAAVAAAVQSTLTSRSLIQRPRQNGGHGRGLRARGELREGAVSRVRRVR